MNTLQQYTDINNGLLKMQQNEKIENESLKQCDNYYQTIIDNKNCVQKFSNISDELSQQFDNQRFDLQQINLTFSNLHRIDERISQIGWYIDNNEGYLHRFFKERQEFLSFKVSDYYETTSLVNLNSSIEHLQNIEGTLRTAVYNEQQRRERVKENWKQFGSIILTILKYAGMVVGFVFLIIWFIIKAIASSKDD